MINGMLESSTGCMKEELRMDIISSNLANLNVVGFKKDRISFQKMLDNAGDSNSATSSIQIRPDMEQGDIRASGAELDVAITGKGFFKIDTEDGIRYTRKGNFILDPKGVLTTQAGDRVMGKGGPINIIGNKIEIDDKGNIYTDVGQIAQLDVVDFEDYAGIVKEGKSFFINQEEVPEMDITSETAINQGYVEVSNVNTAEEMINMIHSLRAFESFQKSMKTIDEINNMAINQVGSIR